VINNDQLTLGDGGNMKLDMNPFLVGMVELMNKKILVRTDQAETTKGKNVVVSDDFHNRMIKPHNPEVGVWKENMLQKPAKRVKPMLAMLIEKYQWQLEQDQRYWVTPGIKWGSFFEAQNWPYRRETSCTEEPRIRMVQHSIDREHGIRQNAQFTDRLGSGNLDHRVNYPDVLRNEGGSSRRPEQTEEHVMMVGS
jgi:hypothetical protein